MNREEDSFSPQSGGSGTGSLVTEQVKQGTQQMVQQTQQTAGQVTESARRSAFSYGESQKQTASQSLHTVAEALHGTGNTLQDKNQAPIAGYAHRAADTVDGFAGYLERTSVQELIGDAERFAREHSTVFLGAAVALGVAAGRFIKASTPQSTGSGGGTLSAGYSQQQFRSPEPISSGAPFADAPLTATPPMTHTGSRTGLVDKVELPDATVFNADLAEETDHGPSR